MSEHTDSKLRELTFRLIAMAPEAPPFPEETVVQVKPSPTPARPVTRRRRVAWFAAAAAAAAILIGGPLFLLNLDGDPEPAPPATQVTAPDGTPTTTSPTALPGLGPGTVVIAHPGAQTATSGGVAVFDADKAVGDGAGGLVVVRNAAIVRIGADGAETTLLDPAVLAAELGPVTVRLEDVAFVDGAFRAVVVVAYGEQYPDVFQEIWLLDLAGGAREPVYQMEAVESNITRVSVAADTMVVSVAFEGGTYFEYLDTAGQPVDVVGPFADNPLGAPDFPALITQAVLSPDGSTFAYVEIGDIQTFEDGYLTADIVVWDLVDGTERRRLQIEFVDGAWPGRLDYDGTGVVLGRDQIRTDTRLTPVRVPSLDAGIITELGTAGIPSLVKP